MVNVLARAELQKLPLREAIRASDGIVEAVKKRLVAAEEITSLGLEILGLSILAIKPVPETARALEAEAREKLFRESDEAIYARRNSAVEQERAIKENELNTEIAVENKKRQIRETQMDAERAVQEKKHLVEKEALAADIGLEGERKKLVALAAENARAEADARAYGVETTMKALATADPKVLQALASTSMKPEQLIAFAFQELAGKAEKIGQLNISPDLLRELMAPATREKMNRLTDKKIVLVTRPTRLAELVIRFNTVSQARQGRDEGRGLAGAGRLPGQRSARRQSPGQIPAGPLRRWQGPGRHHAERRGVDRAIHRHARAVSQNAHPTSPLPCFLNAKSTVWSADLLVCCTGGVLAARAKHHSSVQLAYALTE